MLVAEASGHARGPTGDRHAPHGLEAERLRRARLVLVSEPREITEQASRRPSTPRLAPIRRAGDSAVALKQVRTELTGRSRPSAAQRRAPQRAERP
jgi:hypothetical protein